MSPRWAAYFVKMAELTATKSKDPSTKVGAIIVGPDMEIRSTGYNGFPRGVNDDIPSRFERPDKYDFTVHAELNAILNAARAGISTRGCSLVLNFEPRPCANCTAALIQAGIEEVVGPCRPFEGKGEQWERSLVHGDEMIYEANVETYELPKAAEEGTC